MGMLLHTTWGCSIYVLLLITIDILMHPLPNVTRMQPSPAIIIMEKGHCFHRESVPYVS